MLPLALSLLFAGCVPAEKEVVDAGPSRNDASLADSGPAEDAGAGPDGAIEDSGRPDAGFVDAGPASDRDSDGIPDAEDPEPDRSNPRLFADDFDSADGWLFSSVSMAIDPSSSLLQVNMIEPFEREGWVGPRPNWADYFVRSLIRVDAVGNSSDARSGHAGVIARIAQVTPSRYVTCGIDIKDGRVVLAEHDGTQRFTLAEAPFEASPGEWLLLGFSALRTGYVCEIGGVRVEGASTRFDFGSVGFRSFDATFAADWIEVYEILP